ncbi:MAG: ABC transporter permease, partial [Chloroflexi bacterium]|nr:ABC transporter permease [Chloroflexota bacterium]
MKKWLEPFTTAWVGIVTHKLRSFLTILGIVIGVAAVIALMSIGRGAEADIVSRFETLGSDLITISPGSSSFGGVRSAAGSVTTLTLEDAGAIAEEVPYVTAVAPSLSRSLQIVVGGQNMNSRVSGVTIEYLQAYNLKVADGSFISEYDYQRGARVAVLGANVKETLFEDTDPLGQPIRMQQNIVRVIGVLESKGAMSSSS